MDIKAIFDSIADKAGSIAKSAAKKTGEAAESAKLNIALKSEMHKLEGMFTTLGKLFYEQAKGTDVRAQVAAQVLEIDEQKQVIDDLKLTIAEANNKVICESCGKQIDIDNSFCPICGKKQKPKKLFDDDIEQADAITEEECVAAPVTDELAEAIAETEEE